MLFEPVDCCHVCMVELRQHAGLAFEACEPLGVGSQRLRQHLHRHLAGKTCVFGQIHLAHAASAKLLDDLVGTEGATDHVIVMRGRVASADDFVMAEGFADQGDGSLWGKCGR